MIVEVNMSSVVVEFIRPKRWWHRSRWRLMKPYTSLNQQVTVPKGFVSDGASVPLPMQRLFSPTGAYFSAAIIHDYVIEVEEDWKRANHEFHEELKQLNISWWRRKTLLFAVEFFTTIKYRLGCSWC